MAWEAKRTHNATA